MSNNEVVFKRQDLTRAPNDRTLCHYISGPINIPFVFVLTSCPLQTTSIYYVPGDSKPQQARLLCRSCQFEYYPFPYSNIVKLTLVFLHILPKLIPLFLSGTGYLWNNTFDVKTKQVHRQWL